MSVASRVLVVADDLTGANDTGVQFAQAGWASTLRLGRSASVSEVASGAVAVSTDSRALAPSEAARVTRDAIDREGLEDIDHLYLKVDSTMRGSVAGQLAGALAARRRVRDDSFVVLCPAYPAMGRAVEDGLLLVHGEPVSQSPAGRDPVTPVREDALVDLVPGASVVDLADTPAATAQAWRAVAGVADVLVVDARTDEDLERVAEVVVELGAAVVPAGSAGLAAPLARLWGPAVDREPADSPSVRRPLVLVSSHHTTAHEQVESLAEARLDVEVVSTEVEDLLDGTTGPAPDGAGPVVLVSPRERAESAGGARLAAALGARAGVWLADGGFDAVVLVGGDGAEALLHAVEAHGIAIRGRLLEGVPQGRLAGGPLDGLPVATKAGGFGHRSTLTDALNALCATTTTEDVR